MAQLVQGPTGGGGGEDLRRSPALVVDQGPPSLEIPDPLFLRQDVVSGTRQGRTTESRRLDPAAPRPDRRWRPCCRRTGRREAGPASGGRDARAESHGRHRDTYGRVGAEGT